MNTNKQNPDFLYIGEKLLKWYRVHGRDLPFRKTKDPYLIWICEIVFQQTRIQQGIGHYNRFIERFPDVKSLAEADSDEVMLYWKGLGYYSRALNLHKAAHQIMNDFDGKFPSDYNDILKLKGVGKYTASAIYSICFDGDTPAVDGNFYRVLSRLLADGFDISDSKASQYFTELALQIMPAGKAGDFNQAMMDLGSEICRPKNPLCSVCPLNSDCLAFQLGKVDGFPVKSKKTKVTDLKLVYYFIEHENLFLIRQRADDFIWKKLYEFPTEIPLEFEQMINSTKVVKHKLTHRNLEILIHRVVLTDSDVFYRFAESEGYNAVTFDESVQKSFPKPLENYLVKRFGM